MLEADSAPLESGGIREVLANLDRATREFTRRLEELVALGASPVHTNGASPPEETTERRQTDLERRMSDADAEAERYLEEAKRRADAMVQSIVGAVEDEANAMRHDAEQGIRARWRQVEDEAERFLDDARRAADGLVEERQHRIAELSGTIVGLAEVLTERMVEADRIRRQFDSLVVALSETAGRLATDPATVAQPRTGAAARLWWRDAERPSFGRQPATQARAA